MTKNLKGLEALTTIEELNEVLIVGRKPVVKLRRTFNQKWPNGEVTKYWRVIAPPTHRNYESDLSIEGLRDWGIL